MGKKSKKKQNGGSQCYSTECADHALKVMNDKNALVPFNKNTSLEYPVLTRQTNIIKGGGSVNVWRKIGLSKPNDLVNNIFDGITNIKNTWVGDEKGSTNDTIEHPIANNEILSNKGYADNTIASYLKNNSSFSAEQKELLLKGGGKKRKSRKNPKKGRTNKRSRTNKRGKRKTGKRGKRKTGKRGKRKTGKRKTSKRGKQRTNKK